MFHLQEKTHALSPSLKEALNPRAITWHDIFGGLMAYLFSGIVIVSGLAFGIDFINPSSGPSSNWRALVGATIRFDGVHYRSIAVDGYNYDPAHGSRVAFFPAYPLIVRCLNSLTGAPVDLSLIVISNASFAMTFILMGAYARQRYSGNNLSVKSALISLALLPNTFFFRMAYSESLFLFLTVLTLFAIQRDWPLLLVALLTGAVSATRPVGVAMIAAFLVYAWRNQKSPVPWRMVRLTIVLPVASWGLVAYIAYQSLAFGEPFAFVKTQQHWQTVSPAPIQEQVRYLLSFQSIWDAYDPSSDRYWRLFGHPNPLFNQAFLNPIVFIATLLVLFIGCAERWLNEVEVTLAAGLLAIPYFTRGYEFAMLSTARFSAAVLPLYLVSGRLLSYAGPLTMSLFSGASAFFLGCYAALFAAGYPLF